MALTLKIRSSQVVLTRERSFELLVQNRLGEKPRIEAKREQVEIHGDDTKLLTNAVLVQRDFEAVANQTIELVGRPGDQVTVGQLWATIADLLDRWAIEDRPEKAITVQETATPEAKP